MSELGFEDLNALNKKLDGLLERYIALRTENSELKTENGKLKQVLQEKEEEIKNLKTRYERVKLLGALKGGGENAAEAKRKINELVREIDRCVALLNR